MEKMHEEELLSEEESDAESKKKDIFGEYTDEEETSEEEDENSDEAAYFDLMRLAKERNGELREKKQDGFERVGFEESEAQEMTNDAMVIKDVEQFMSMYAYLLTKMGQLEDNDRHLKVMDKLHEIKTKKKCSTHDAAWPAVKKFRKDWKDLMMDVNMEDDEEEMMNESSEEEETD